EDRPEPARPDQRPRARRPPARVLRRRGSARRRGDEGLPLQERGRERDEVRDGHRPLPRARGHRGARRRARGHLPLAPEDRGVSVADGHELVRAVPRRRVDHREPPRRRDVPAFVPRHALERRRGPRGGRV
ncbi:MAG: hypothetical protein AVDCRST_MAG85-835, partial [uncultured Solirubrobacteraceae bacterium]